MRIACARAQNPNAQNRMPESRKEHNPQQMVLLIKQTALRNGIKRAVFGVPYCVQCITV